MQQAVLRTSRLTLVPLAEEHLDDEVELDSDPEVMRYLGAGRARSRAEVTELHRRRLAVAAQVPGLGFWAGFLDRSAAYGQPAEHQPANSQPAVGPSIDNRFVGWWILEPVDGPDGRPVEAQAELGYRLLRRHWRQGLAGEGARELVRHGFAELGLQRIVARTMAVNVASRATMASVGLSYQRTFHEAWDEPIPGAEHGEVEYAITADEWARV